MKRRAVRRVFSVIESRCRIVMMGMHSARVRRRTAHQPASSTTATSEMTHAVCTARTFIVFLWAPGHIPLPFLT